MYVPTNREYEFGWDGEMGCELHASYGSTPEAALNYWFCSSEAYWRWFSAMRYFRYLFNA